jgi:chromosomal replication initiator protein
MAQDTSAPAGPPHGRDQRAEARELWQEVCQRLRSSLPPAEYQTWIEPLGLRLEGEGRVVVEVPNRFYAQWIQERHLGRLTRALAESLGGPPRLSFAEAAAQARPLAAAPAPAPAPAPNPLSQAYSFDTFVVGPCNELAHAASLAVAEHPGTLYNPLVIFGAAGLGKTHLLNATGNHISGRLPGRRLVYCSSEAFTNELIQAVRFDGVAAFREKYRQVDGLLLDDLQFLAGRERTQEEFFHTFNALYEAGKQIILTSDKMPRDIPGLEKRLQTRFEWGLLTDLQPPDQETKVAILQKKAAEQGVDLSRQVCFYLASQPESNVRVLEGYLTRVVAVSRFQGVEITLELVKRVVSPMVGERQLELEQVVAAVAGHYGVKVADLKGSKKTRDITRPRQVAMYLARRLTAASFPRIGKALGNKDHSTVVKGVKRLGREMASDPDLAERVRSLERLLREGAAGPGSGG